MSKKIAKKILLIILLGFMILGGVSAPGVNFKAPKAEASIFNWVAPKKTAETPVKGDDGTKKNSCNTCFVAVKTGTIWNMLSAPIDTVLSLIPRILVFVIKWIVILLAKLLQALMAPQGGGLFFKLNQFMPTYNEAGQQTSFIYWLWSVSLYYANILITLFLIWIAINIILEKKEYTNYQNLIKLVGVALLVNFSLVICAVFVDISNFIATLFMSNIAMNSFSCMYACTIHKVANIFNCKQDNMIFSLTISNSLALMVGLVFVGQILGLIMYVLTRMVYLWFLVGISPIAFVLSAIPETRKYYKQWSDLFIANLTKLPALAFASYFILNMMIYISNNYMMSTDTANTNWMQNILGMGNNTASENLWISTLGIVFILFILSQALLMVAQNLGVEQISKASAFATGWAKKGWDAVKNPTMSYGRKKLLSSKPMQSFTKTLTGSKIAPLTRLGNKVADQMTREQKKSQGEINYWKENLNAGMLERIVNDNKSARGDKTKFLQAIQALSEMQSKGDYKDPGVGKNKIKILDNPENMSMVKNLVADDLYGETDAGKFMKKRYTWVKAGPKSEDYKSAAEKILGTGASEAALNKKMEELAFSAPYYDAASFKGGKLRDELYGRATDQDKAGLNDWHAEIKHLFDASKTNPDPEKFAEMFQLFQKTISAKKMQLIFNKLPNVQRATFWDMIARMAIVAKKVKDKKLGSNNLDAEFTNIKPDEIYNDAEDALSELAGGQQYSWMATPKNADSLSFARSLRDNDFIKLK